MAPPEKRDPNLVIDLIIVIIAACLLISASRFGLEAGQPAHKGAGTVYGGLYLIYLGVLFLLSYIFGRGCYIFTFLQFICMSCSHPAGRHMALFYFFLSLVIGSFVLLTGLGVL